MNNSEVRKVIQRAIDSIPIDPNYVNDLSLMQRAVLRGKHPVEFLLNTFAQIPDSFLPHIVTVSKAIARAADSEE